MSGLANLMSNTTGGISRLYCESCASETLHRSNRCGCGAVHVAYPCRTLTQLLRNSINLPGSRPVRRK